MARYVLVDADGIDMTIKYGPIELEDPSQYSVPEGNKLLLESTALGEGYRYAEGGGALAPENPDGDDSADDEDDDEDRRGRRGGGDGARGPQGPQGGQGAQTQPGGQGNPNQ
ncbi:hypothetical protein [Streptomyces sp. NBC_01451]|uniref:hypothetical protein n=1 Tax=Streptomyces sp. NBC_01451 TaxID=2903872 RepID=UPI002E33A0FB|nr:hypothetical protein [Streptomyces sp. NBC_01451]